MHFKCCLSIIYFFKTFLFKKLFFLFSNIKVKCYAFLCGSFCVHFCVEVLACFFVWKFLRAFLCGSFGVHFCVEVFA